MRDFERLLSNRTAMRGALAVLLVALVAAGLSVHRTHGRTLAPPLPAAVLSGHAVTLAQLRGHPAAIVFFASWCTDCKVEANAVERFARSSAGRGRVVAIDTTDGGNWRAFLRAHDWTFPVFADRSGVTLAAYGVSVGLPATVIVDSTGHIASTKLGPETTASLQHALATTS